MIETYFDPDTAVFAAPPTRCACPCELCRTEPPGACLFCTGGKK